MGGLGFKDLLCFNVALLGRQVWRLASCKDTFCFKVLSTKYFPDGDIFRPKKVDKPSFTWKTIVRAACILHEGFRWNAGNGRKIDFWQENWGVEGLSGTSICLNRREVHETRVSKLVDGSNGGWREERVREIFGEYMGDQICKIPTLHNGLDDHRIWFHNQLGSYSTKSAYSWMTLK